MNETWYQMIIRHNRELRDFQHRAEAAAYQAGLDASPLAIKIGPMPKGVAQIACRIADKYDIDLQDMRSPSRARALAYPRHEAFHEAHKFGFGPSEIGRYFNRHHTTVLHGIAGHKKREGIR